MSMPDVVRMGGVCVLYVATATFGLSLDAVSGFAAAVWPPTGIALVALVLYGYGLWPGIAVGAFLVNLSVGAPVLVAGGIALGNTLEAVVGAIALKRVVAFRPSLERLQDVLGLVVLAAGLSTLISATIGVTSGWLGGVIAAAAYGEAWRTWWLGDALGALVVAPLLFIWSGYGRVALPRRLVAEAIVLLVAIGALSLLTFSPVLAPTLQPRYIVFPALIWAAVRLGPPGAVTATALVSASAIWGTAQSAGPFAGPTLHEGLVSLQAFMGIVAVTSLVLAAVVAERRQAEATAHEQRERLHVTLSGIGDAVMATDGWGRVMFMNPVAESLTGWPATEALGKDITAVFQIVNEFTRRVVENPIGKVMRAGTVVGLANHTLLIARDGVERPIDDSGAPIRDAEGRLLGVVLVFRDITARRQAESTREQLAAIVESSADAIIGKTLDGIIMSWNRSAERLYGYTAAEAIGQPITRLSPPDIADEIPRLLERLARGERIEQYETQRLRKDGTRVDVSLTISPIRDPAGQIIGASTIARDITERRRAQQRFTVAVEAAPNAMIMVDQDGRILLANAHTERLFGYTRQELLGQSIDLLVPERVRQTHGSARARFVQQPSARAMGAGRDLYGRRKDGTEVPIEIGLNPIETPEGLCTLAAVADITARKQANAHLERRIQERTALLQLLYDLAVVANTAPTLEEAIQQALDRICVATGWPVGHAYLPATEGSGVWVPTPLWHLDDSGRFAAFQQATQTTRVAPGEGLIGRVGRSGQAEWCEDVATDPGFLRPHAAAAVHLKAGYAVPLLMQREVVGVLEFYTDVMVAPDVALLDALRQVGIHLGRVIERQRAAEQAQRQQEALLQREKLAAMSTLLASVAHELNNPLASLVLHAELLGEEVRGGALAEPVAEIAQAAARCERLVQQFLTLARQHPPERVAVALNTLVAETVEILAYPLRIDNVAVDLHLDDQLPLLWGDPHQLQQVLLNLLTNAQQALRAAPGLREVTCTTQYDPTQHQITLTVADTGPGIPAALQARIFEPFFTTKPPGVGTGLGLPLCRGIIEAHGGTLSMTSAQGQGATFRVMLPVQTVLTPLPAPPGGDAAGAARSGTILIVDDELSLAKGLARLLERDGHTVDTVANGRLALAKLAERAYDCILSDVRMPELDGPSLYRLLERQQPHLCQRLIFLTGDTLEPATRAFLEASGAPCLMKPFAIAEARRAVQRVLRLGSAADPARTPLAARESTTT
jgi:two-component system NtrC family sensor kinase